jgi:large subunit ribosomal protein L24
MQRLKVGDEVVVLTGKDAKTRGKILSMDRKHQRVVVDKVNMVHRHLKPNRSAAHPRGGIIERPQGIHVSNVMLVIDGRPTRVGTRSLEDGRRVRVARATNEMIDKG